MATPSRLCYPPPPPPRERHRCGKGWRMALQGGGGGLETRLPRNVDNPHRGIRMRVRDRYRPAQSRSAKQKSKRKALQ